MLARSIPFVVHNLGSIAAARLGSVFLPEKGFFKKAAGNHSYP